MSDMSVFVLGLVIVLAALLLVGAFLTYVVVAGLKQAEAGTLQTIGWEPGRDRLATIRGAWRLFAAIWSRRGLSEVDARMARAITALRCVHVLYFALFFFLLAFFLVVAIQAQ